MRARVAIISRLIIVAISGLALLLGARVAWAEQVACHGSQTKVQSAAATIATELPAGSTAKDKCICYHPQVKDKSGKPRPFGKSCVISSAYTPTNPAPKLQGASAVVAYRDLAKTDGGVQIACVGDTSVQAGTCKTVMRAESGAERKADVTEEQAQKIEGWPSVGAQPSMVNTGNIPLSSSNALNKAFELTVFPEVPTAPGPSQPTSGQIGTTPSNLPSGVVSRPSAGAQIQNIANTPSPGGQQGWNPTGQQSTFSPSPAISGNPFSLGPLFIGSGGGAGGASGGGGGYAPVGGTIAYVPVSQYPGLTSPNFDPPTGIAFPEAKPSPEEILENLAKNTKRMPPGKVTAAQLRGGVVDNAVLRAINDFVTPVGDFVRAFFAGDVRSRSAEADTAAPQRVDEKEKPPLERGRLVLTLAADDSLVPGDPSQAGVGRFERAYEAFESIPESNRTWVQNAPRAREGIERIANAPPTYGWGDIPADEDAAAAPEVADSGYEPFATGGSIIPSFGIGEGEERPRSFFSVMGKSFGTIGEAVSNLFRRISSALFWWL